MGDRAPKSRIMQQQVFNSQCSAMLLWLHSRA
jgi:hypothetical protein